MDTLSDVELMHLVYERNTLAFKTLYRRYELRIFNFILRYTGNREIAQDILQEAFTRMWFAAHTFDFKRGYFRGWLYKIALNTARNEMSKKRYEFFYTDISVLEESGAAPLLSDEDRPDIAAERSEMKDKITNYLGKLPPQLREIILLKHFQQLKFREIARITDTPEGTLKARFHRALDKLREMIEPLEK